MSTDDTGHDAASDLPWDDDAPLPPYPVLATDPDPGAPMNPTETFPHVVARTHEVFSVCRCGRGVMPSQDVGVIFGDDCPAALREALANERAFREGLEAVVKAARVLRQDIRVIHEDDPNFAFCPICGAAEHEVGCTVPLLDEALASLQYKALSSDYP